MAHAVSPLAPTSFPEMPAIAGISLAAAATGIRYKGRPDVLLAIVPQSTTVAGCLTKSKSPSAPVDWCVASLKQGKARALVVNAGNANAFTGKAGIATVKAVAQATAKLIGCKPAEVFQASTGVIGEPLNPAPITGALEQLKADVKEDAWSMAASAIMTTDTFAKMATVKAKVGGKTITINGIAKGSGMIAPDMATMLVFIFTDAKMAAKPLQKALTAAVNPSFNCITVDGDTSTSDTVLLFATGAGAEVKSPADHKAFNKALDALCLDLALQVAKDGEGAEKLIEIKITGAENDKAAHKIGMTIANSPLVKTAIAGEDANWGRIVMAIGKSGEKAIRDKLRIKIGGILVAAKGMKDPNYKEADIMPHMKGRDIRIEADIGVGKGKSTVWTCDLTHRYIDINGSYRS
ncbi:bifunctional glutamate N-acetyltransferase/amino-acid acetyltransferase ArgJ [Aestuariivirga litoralis]|uniref:bifunctional glutamate N-acetyltransferase/amino-acid acetyltransferase ArgJ n=1 Tax=Aestuariivirga litoralis TaxID=2650924 RepID=UPI0018C7E2B0|nr:bifunctional glutamate N-acetyltransferase/amino-acid acetyltransferase ArgJ [Aestuariivirga litoralis]MBG1233352.1 bifunctional glutamate N-acetyltransferase/amino-acid acetyltransferase ArgJ [Aestuariivirga litoralis]